MSALLLAAAIADAVAVAVHGGVGHRWLADQLRETTLPPSALFGDADVGRRVLWVTWHAVTALFAVSGGALLATSAGWVDHSAAMLRFIALLHGAVLLVGAVCLVRRLDALLRPVPPVFVACMSTVAIAAWFAA